MSAFWRIRARLAADWAMARRDPISLYILLAPIIFAVLIRAFVPGLGSGTPTFAVLESVPLPAREILARHGQIVLFPDQESLEARVNRPDDVPGFVPERNSVTMLLQGDEAEASGQFFRLVLLDVIAGGGVLSVSDAPEGDGSPMLLRYLAIVVLMTTVLLGGHADRVSAGRRPKFGCDPRARRVTASPAGLSCCTLSLQPRAERVRHGRGGVYYAWRFGRASGAPPDRTCRRFVRHTGGNNARNAR